MAIVYTNHAEEMIVFRRLDKKLVEKCLKNPDKILPTREGRKIYLKDLGRNYLKVIVSKEHDNLMVITLYWLAKKLKSK